MNATLWRDKDDWRVTEFSLLVFGLKSPRKKKLWDCFVWPWNIHCARCSDEFELNATSEFSLRAFALNKNLNGILEWRQIASHFGDTEIDAEVKTIFKLKFKPRTTTKPVMIDA